MSAQSLGADEGPALPGLRRGEDALCDEGIGEGVHGAGDGGVQRAEGEVDQLRAEEGDLRQGGGFLRGDEAGGDGPVQGIRKVGVGDGAVAQGPEQKLRILVEAHGLVWPPESGGVAVGIALGIGVAHVLGAVGAGLDVREGEGGASVGQGGVLLSQDPEEHDEGLDTGGGHLQVKALAEAREAAPEEVHGLQGGGHGVIVHGVRQREGAKAQIVQHRRPGGNGDGGHGVLRHQIAVVLHEGGAAGNLLALSDIHHGAGGKADLGLAGQQQDIEPGAAAEGIPIFQAALGPGVRRGGSCGV